MIRTVLLLTLVGAALASHEGYGYGYEKKSAYCWQCQYVPSKAHTTTVYDTEEYETKIPHTSVHCWYEYAYQGEAAEAAARPEAACGVVQPQCEPTTTYTVEKHTRQVPRQVTEYTKPGGYGPCAGPILSVDAGKAAGIDDWDCHGNNCYRRTDPATGRVTRGCYKHELNVNPNLLGCHIQDGAEYCFCHGDHCNGA